jgi:preprotein translocase subunit SecA
MGVDMAHDKADAVNLLPQGQEALTRLVEPLGGAWRLRRYREDQVHLALTAIHVLKRDVHYLVQGDEVQIIDGTTGRLAIGRSWSRGLHQMVCIKERLALPAQTETLTQATYQTFFPRYHRVCGLSGTLWEERGELLGVYGLPVVRVASRFESGRLDLGLLMCASQTEQWLAVASQVRAMVEQGRAVLIGTDTVADSEALAEVLTSMAIPHALLNARHDGEGGDAERMVIEAAGGPGQVTVATHMAGRGTDIRVHPDVLARGGLHVINTHLNPSGRIDRQLRGRCARQGQPGSHQRILSLDDSTLKPWMRRAWFRWLASWGMRTSPRVLAWCCAWAQRQASLQARWQRWAMLQLELGMRKPLALSGRRDWV